VRIVLTLSDFALRAIRRDPDGGVSLAVERALTALRERLEGGQWVPPVPRFLAAADGGDAVFPALVVEVEVEPGRHLLEEARRQGVTIGPLASHAVVLHLASLDRSRA
jgi:hypothetical protein